MYQILIWSDRYQEFEPERDIQTFKIKNYETETEALLRASEYDVQTRIQFVRGYVKKAKKTMKSGRVQRFRTAEFFGERVRIVATVDSSGRRVKA